MRKSQSIPFQCWVLNKRTTGTIFIMSLLRRGPWLGIGPWTSSTRSQDSTTRLSRRRCLLQYILLHWLVYRKQEGVMAALSWIIILFNHSQFTISWQNAIQTFVCQWSVSCKCSHTVDNLVQDNGKAVNISFLATFRELTSIWQQLRGGP